MHCRDSVQNAFFRSRLQTCIVHLMRNVLRYVGTERALQDGNCEQPIYAALSAGATEAVCIAPAVIGRFAS